MGEGFTDPSPYTVIGSEIKTRMAVIRMYFRCPSHLPC